MLVLAGWGSGVGDSVEGGRGVIAPMGEVGMKGVEHFHTPLFGNAFPHLREVEGV